MPYMNQVGRQWHAKHVYLLNPQTEVEDAVGAVGLSIRPSHFSDEVRQSKAQLSRVALKDVFFNIYWTDHNTFSETHQWLRGTEEQILLKSIWNNKLM